MSKLGQQIYLLVSGGKSFFVNWNPASGSPPTVGFQDYEVARSEAERIASCSPGSVILTLEVVSSSKTTKATTSLLRTHPPSTTNVVACSECPNCHSIFEYSGPIQTGKRCPLCTRAIKSAYPTEA